MINEKGREFVCFAPFNLLFDEDLLSAYLLESVNDLFIIVFNLKPHQPKPNPFFRASC